VDVRHERHPLPGGSVLQANRPSRLHVLHESTPVEPAKVACQLEIDVELVASIERRVDRLHHFPILVAADPSGGTKAERPRRQGARVLDHVGDPSGRWAEAARILRYWFAPAILHSTKRM